MRVSFFAPLAIALTLVFGKENSEITELGIESTYKPEDCTYTAKKGDKIQVRRHSSSDRRAQLTGLEGALHRHAIHHRRQV